MDFQTHQAQAKQNTTVLFVLFFLGLIALIALVSVLVTAIVAYSTKQVDLLRNTAIAAPLTIFVVGGSSAVKTALIKQGGGSYVATSLGGRQVDFNTLDRAEKQLSNVVEEIAVASGMPVPAVFVLDHEPGINAFAAGWTSDNAAIGVTRGTLQHLTRAELQGVIAHEFAHIRNGDTRINTQLIGWVFGITVLSGLAHILLDSIWYTPRRRSSKGGGGGNLAVIALALGLGLLVIGAVGTFFARMIQAAVSREREHLADASAVQFTRDPAGLGEALSKIGGMGSDNRIYNGHAVEAGHLFFSTPHRRLFSSHPPLKSRIKRLDPTWDGAFRAPDPQAGAHNEARNPANAADWQILSGQMLPGETGIPGMSNNKALPFDPAILFGVGGAAPPAGLPSPAGSQAQNGGNSRVYQPPTFDGPTEEHILYARQLLARIPEATQKYLHTRGGAVASVLGLLLSTDPVQRAKDLDLAAHVSGLDADYIDAASDVISRLDRPLQLPAIDIALHSIRETPWNFQENLLAAVIVIESSRPDQDLFRWILRRVLIRHLEDQHDTGESKHNITFDELIGDVAVALTALAWFNSAGKEAASDAFTKALVAVGMPIRPLPPEESLSVPSVDASLDRLTHLDYEGRRRFVHAAIVIVEHDATTTADEAELIRVIADAVRLPMPPLLPVAAPVATPPVTSAA